MSGSSGQSPLAEVSASLRRAPFGLLLAICEAADANEADDLVHDSLRLVGDQELSLLRHAASAEIHRTRDAPQLFRSTSVASKLLSRFTRSNRETIAWLRSVLEKPVASILDSRVILADLDGKDTKGGAKKGLLSRTMSTGAMGETLNKPQDHDSAPSTMHLSGDAKRSLAKLEGIARSFLDSIFASTARMPRSLRELCHHMQVESVNKFGEQIKLNRGLYSCCSSLVFLRFVCPAILSPQSFGLSKTSPPTDVMRTLVLVSKVLTAAANGTTMSEPQLVTLNAFLMSQQARMTDFFTFMCANPDAPAPIALQPSASGSGSMIAGAGSMVNASPHSSEKFRALFASSPAIRPGPAPAAERDRPTALPEVTRVHSINREERALMQVLSWAAKHAFTVQTSVKEREELTDEERAALTTEWEAFLANLMRLPPEMLSPAPRSSRTARSARDARDAVKESPAVYKHNQKEARKSRLLETIGDWLDGSESRARKMRAKSEAAPRPPTQDLLLALETPEVSAWLVDMEKKGGDSRQAVLYIYALLEELYRLRTDAELRRPRASSRTGLSASPSANSSLASPSPISSARKASVKRRVHMSEGEAGNNVTSPRRLQESASKREKEREREREREKKKEKEKEKEKQKEALERSSKESAIKDLKDPRERDKDKDKAKDKDKKAKERKKDDSERDRNNVRRSSSSGPTYGALLSPRAEAKEKEKRTREHERRRSVNYGSTLVVDK